MWWELIEEKKKGEGGDGGGVGGWVQWQKAVNLCRRLIYAGRCLPWTIISCCPTWESTFLERVSMVNSHIWGCRGGEVCFHPPGNLSVSCLNWELCGHVNNNNKTVNLARIRVAKEWLHSTWANALIWALPHIDHVTLSNSSNGFLLHFSIYVTKGLMHSLSIPHWVFRWSKATHIWGTFFISQSLWNYQALWGGGWGRWGRWGLALCKYWDLVQGSRNLCFSPITFALATLWNT